MESIWPLVTWIKTIHRLLYRAQFVLLIRTTWWYSLDCFVQISFSALAFVNINYEEVRRKSPWGHLVICFRKSIFTSSQEVYYVLAKYGRTPVSRCIYHFGLYYRWREHTWIYWFGWLVLAHQADEEFRKAISGWDNWLIHELAFTLFLREPWTIPSAAEHSNKPKWNMLMLHLFHFNPNRSNGASHRHNADHRPHKNGK